MRDLRSENGTHLKRNEPAGFCTPHKVEYGGSKAEIGPDIVVVEAIVQFPDEERKTNQQFLLSVFISRFIRGYYAFSASEK